MKLTMISVEFRGRKIAVFTYTRDGKISQGELERIAEQHLGMPNMRGLTFSHG